MHIVGKYKDAPLGTLLLEQPANVVRHGFISRAYHGVAVGRNARRRGRGYRQHMIKLLRDNYIVLRTLVVFLAAVR